MRRARILCAFLALVALGCSPEGPPEFYRNALQARSEFVDSLTFIVDEPSAKEVFPVSEKRYRARMSEINDKLAQYRQTVRMDQSLRKLNREDFKLTMIEPDVRGAVESGLKAYLFYTRNITYTNVRLGREIQRLQLVQEVSIAKAQETDPNANVGNFPYLSTALQNLTGKENSSDSLRFLQTEMEPKNLAKLGMVGLDDADIIEMAKFKDDVNVKLPDLVIPPPPARPAWLRPNNAKKG